jgi:AraC-like DNA-binding protein
VTDLASEFGCTSGENPADWVVLLINRHQIGSELLAPLGDRPTIFDDKSPLVAALYGFIAGFSESAKDRASGDASVSEELNVFGDAVGKILQILLRTSEHAAPAKARSIPSKILQICRHIDEDLASPKLAPESLARQFGVSRASLYRMFEPLGGVARYIRLQKIARASVQLQKADSRMPLSAIAQSSGFSSADAFVRAFRESYGTTPRDYRSMQSMASAAGHTSLESWLERNYFWKTNTPRPGAGAQITDGGDAGSDYATADVTAE